MKNDSKKIIAYILSWVMIISFFVNIPVNLMAAVRKPVLSDKKIVLEKGQNKKIKVKRIGKSIKVKWKSRNKKIASITKKGKVKAKKTGGTYIICKFMYKGKKYTKKCKVIVRDAVKKIESTQVLLPAQPQAPVLAATASITPILPQETATLKPTQTPIQGDLPSQIPNPTSSTAPMPTATSTPIVTSTPTVTPTQAVTSSPTATPMPTATPLPTVTPTQAVTQVPVTPIPVTDQKKALEINFEDGKNSYMTGRQGEETLTVVSGGYDDNYSLKVSNRKKNWAGPIVDVTYNIKDYVTYTVEAYVKHTTGSNKTINCMWDTIDYHGNRTYTTIKTIVVPTGNWRKIEATVVAPGDVEKMSIYFEMQNYSDDFYVDNISVTEKHLDMDAVLAVKGLKESFSKRFPVGCAVYSYNLKNPEIVQFISHHYNTITFGDELKPENLLNKERTQNAGDGLPKINTDMIDKCLGLAVENNFKVRFHTLVWFSQTPVWFFCENYEPEYDGKGTDNENITNLVDKTEMLMRIESYVKQVITYTETNYSGTVYAYDVVNEAIDSANSCKLRSANTSLYGAIFTDDDNTYITEAFRYAKEAKISTGSDAKLFYNDFVGLASPGQMKAVVKYLADAKNAGYIDGLGMQAHQSNLGVTDGDNIKNALKMFEQNGYEVQITELDFASKDNSESGNEILANAYSKFMKIIFERMDVDNVNVSNVTFWNLTDLDTWLNGHFNDATYYPSLFDENYMPKKAFYALTELADGTEVSPTGTPVARPTVAPTNTPTIRPTSDPAATPTAIPTGEPSDAVALNIGDGNIVITQNGYSISGGNEIKYSGAYLISGTTLQGHINITGGEHKIIIDDCTIASSGASPISISGGASVTLILRGSSTLTAPDYYAGIEVPKGCELTISGDGALNVTGGKSSAGIGASSTGSSAGTLGKIIIQSGTIIALNAGRNAAGIGDAQSGHGGGEIVIYGGTIFAKSSGNGAGIGGGGSAASDVQTIVIRIYGGMITAGGSTYEIGDGRGQSHCEVYVYGGSYRAQNGKTLFGSVEKTAGIYAGEIINVSSYPGIQCVTVDGVSQNISSFFIIDEKGSVSARYALNLYMTKNEPHIIVVTDADGVEHVTNVIR